MPLSGRVSSVTVKDDENPQDINKYTNNTKLELITKKSKERILIKLPPDDQIVCQFDLDDCSYVEESSVPGKVECIRINSQDQTVVIMDQKKECVELLDYVRNYLKKRSSSPITGESDDEAGKKNQPKQLVRKREQEQREEEERERDRKRQREQRETEKREREQREAEKRERLEAEKRERLEAEKRQRKPESEPESDPEPIQNEKVNRLIRALNDNNAEDAAKYARDLAKKKESIRFTLDMINESGNAAQRQPKQPVVKPLELKLSIESFLIDSYTGEQYKVAILPSATINDLKQIVQREAGVNPEQQYWYINRDLLPNDYKFDGTQRPRVDEKTVLTLYIAKP